MEQVVLAREQVGVVMGLEAAVRVHAAAVRAQEVAARAQEAAVRAQAVVEMARGVDTVAEERAEARAGALR